MHILITAGPTREYLDDVRYLSNASSGKMGYALAAAALQAGHTVTLVSGPVALAPPPGCAVVSVESTEEMLAACLAHFSACDGVIGAAAVCDYRPHSRVPGKLCKTGGPQTLQLVETPDILAELGRLKREQWIVGFALEAGDGHRKALVKLQRKQCDAIILNSPAAIAAETSRIELLDASGSVLANWTATKLILAERIIGWIDSRLAPPR